MEFRLLGPVEAQAPSGRLDVGPPRQRTVLAALCVDAGRLVRVDTLIDRVWSGKPPDRATHALYVYIARLRRVLRAADVPLVHRSGGYLLDVDPARVDVHRFRQLVEAARDPRLADPERVALLRQALDLWRGMPLADLSGEWADRVRVAWRPSHLDATVAWAQAALRLGGADTVIGPLAELTAEYPLAEPLAAVLMRALHATEHHAEALERYAGIRQRLVEELGTEPGAELREIHQQVLRGVQEPAPPAPVPVRPAAVPAQLPLDLYSFTGRAAELDRLDAILDSAAEQPNAVLVAAISGTAGVGKTTLAVHWAHRVAGRFPDGQLYVNLRGHDDHDGVLSPARAVRGFLDALDVPARRIPADPAGQVALYRSLLAGRRMLVVLDNARDAEQVRPLLPGGSGCLVVVTSRDNLAGLVATEGARPLSLDLLSPAEAGQLLVRHLGEARVTAEPRAARDIVESCARLPLALAIVAARAAIRPAQPLSELADELRGTGQGLDPFDAGDARSDVRTVFSWSYRTLGAAAARLFRLLGVHPGPDVSAAAVASLLGLPVERSRLPLAELLRAHLLTEPVPGRYACHDLLRRYAAELAGAVDTDADRRATARRVLDHYLHTAYAATMLLHPYQLPIPPPAPPAPGVTPGRPGDQDAALDWMTTEYPVLLAAVRQAAATGFEVTAWKLAWTLTTFVQRQGRLADWVDTQSVALAAAERIGDRVGQAHLHRTLGRAYQSAGRHDEALVEVGAAVDLFRELPDPAGLATAYLNLAEVHELQGRYESALAYTEEALELYRATNRESGLAYALNAAGWYHVELGRGEAAVRYCHEALALQEKIADRHGQAATLDTLGFAYQRLGQHQQAIRSYRRAVELTRHLADRPNEAAITDRLGDAHEAAGDPAAARTAWRQALEIYDELAHPDAESLRAKVYSTEPGDRTT